MTTDSITDHKWKTIRVTRDGPIVTVTLNRPDKRNAFRPQTVSEMHAALLAVVSFLFIVGEIKRFELPALSPASRS